MCSRSLWSAPVRFTCTLVRSRTDAELVQQMPYSLLDLVPDRAHLVEALPGRVIQCPFLVSFAGEDRAGVAAAHRDDNVRGANDLVRPGLRELLGNVDVA